MNNFRGRHLVMASRKRNEFRSTSRRPAGERNSFRWAAGPVLYPEDVHRRGLETTAVNIFVSAALLGAAPAEPARPQPPLGLGRQARGGWGRARRAKPPGVLRRNRAKPLVSRVVADSEDVHRSGLETRAQQTSLSVSEARRFPDPDLRKLRTDNRSRWCDNHSRGQGVSAIASRPASTEGSWITLSWPSLGRDDPENLPSVTKRETSMKNSSSRRVPNRGTKASSRGFSEPAGHGFSRPLPPRGTRRCSEPRAWKNLEPFTINPVWVFLELQALALDDERARSYLARPGCNVGLGMAHRARTMVKRARILRFLRDDRPANDDPVVRSGVSCRRAAGMRGGNA